jgi:parallel beta-helix repeat protein
MAFGRDHGCVRGDRDASLAVAGLAAGGRWGSAPRRRTVGVAAAVGVCALLLVSGAMGAGRSLVRYVDGSTARCSDGPGSGPRKRPFCTIGAAARSLPAGGTVVVASGVYRESVVVSSSGTRARPLVFAAAPRASVVITDAKSGFAIHGRSWISVRGFTITRTRDYGIDVTDASHVTLVNNRVRYAGQPVPGAARYGIRLSDVNESVVAGNTVDHNTNAGIALVAGSTRCKVSGNRSFANAQGFERAAAGIRLYDARANTIMRNVSYNNEDSGIELVKSADNLVDNNISYANGDHGIDNTEASTGTRILANSIYGNVTAGINVEGGSTEAILANNISADNGMGSPRTHSDIRVDAASVSGTSLDYDVVSLTAPDTVLIWKSISYRSLVEFQVLTGQELHGIDSDPKWKDPEAGNFHLTSRSPAIDSADSLVSGQPSTDLRRKRRVDDPLTPNTGAGPRPYDDRGAYEFQPSLGAGLLRPDA